MALSETARRRPKRRLPRILLADDHAIVGEGIRRILASDFHVVRLVGNGRDLVEAALQLLPDVVVADISMPLLNGIEAARQVLKQHPETKVILLTMHADAVYVREAFRAGASGYVLKQAGSKELAAAVRAVLRGERYLSPSLASSGIALPDGHQDASGHEGLTSRQVEVLQLIAEGHPAKKIASILQVSMKTVEFHRARIGGKLKLRTTAELTRYAVKHGIVS